MKNLLLFAALICSLSFTSCRKDPLPTKDIAELFIKTASDPYSGPASTNEYYLVQDRVDGDNIILYYSIYTNRENGEARSTAGSYYYNPTRVSSEIHYGKDAAGNVADLKKQINDQVSDHRYAVVKVSSPGGPDTRSYSLLPYTRPQEF